MKLKNVKTEKEFWDVADNWYQRTHKLREIAEGQNIPKEKRQKALKLFFDMLKRMILISLIAAEINAVKAEKLDFPKGGFHEL